MPSLVLGYVPGSGFTPLVSGIPWSGQSEPLGGIQLYANPSNSGAVYIALSGGNAFSGQYGTLVGSGGPTINSGAMTLSGGGFSGAMDGFPVFPGAGFFIPKLAIQNTGANSGVINISLGCDPACSGQARVHWYIF